MSIIPSIWVSLAPRMTGLALDAVIALLADAQHGVVARWQLKALGFADGAIKHRIKTGRLRPLHRGVYAVGHRHLTVRGLRMAAVLACGSGGFLTYASAAAARDLRRTSQAHFDVTVPAGRRRRRPGIRVHESAVIHPDDVSLVDGIPTASVPRILLDLAQTDSPTRIRYVVEQADRIGVFDLRAVDAAIARSPRRKGVPKLQRVLADYRPAPFLRSRLEVDVRDELDRRLELPRHLSNQKVGDVEVDVWFPDSRLAVQIDTPAYHGGPTSFETDRSDDIKLGLLGCRPIRITGKRWENERRRVLWEIETLSRFPPPPGIADNAQGAATPWD